MNKISCRKNQRQIWADVDFIQRLEEIRAKKILNHMPVNNLGEITKELINTESFQKLEDEIIKKGDKNIHIRIRMDGNFFK